MTATTALFCAHADVNGDADRCPCSVPPGMQIESDWHRANGQVSRILTSQDLLAWIYAVQHVDGTIRAATVVHAYDDRDFTAAQARRLGEALIEAADHVDELLTRGGGMRVKLAADEIDALNGAAL